MKRGVLASDVNDLLTPSASCVIQMDKSKLNPGSFPAPMFPTAAASTFNSESNATRNPSNSVARIALSDCLTCSGCVTSAETVLLETQSTESFEQLLKSQSKSNVSVVSLSQQSVASIAVAFNLSLNEAALYISGFLKSRYGISKVISLSNARNIALRNTLKEFLIRNSENGKLPMLTSSCPGVVCYMEKRLDCQQLELLSHSMSPMATAGALVKTLNGNETLHMSVMPCADKKLEAAREQLRGLIDVVLTTSELHQLILQSESPKLSSYLPTQLDSLAEEEERRNDEQNSRMEWSGGGPSGGYLEYVLRESARLLFGIELLEDTFSDPRIIVTEIRSSDFREVRLVQDGNALLCFAYAYGFRSIQNLFRKIQSKRCKYQFVEIMSCPSGCINGGGQIGPTSGNGEFDLMARKKTLLEIEKQYSSATKVLPSQDAVALSLESRSDAPSNQLQTTFQAVPKLQSVQIDW